MIGGVASEVAILEGEGEEKGMSTLSELATRNCIEDEEGIGVTEDDKIKGTSQNSPVNPAKHWQVKIPPNSSAIDAHVPLLQSINSQISMGGLGLGETVRMKDDVIVSTIGTSQNKPVNPGKHSQVTKSPSSSIHTPLVQLMKSHSVILAVGVGETMIELKGGAVNVGKLELIATVD